MFLKYKKELTGNTCIIVISLSGLTFVIIMLKFNVITKCVYNPYSQGNCETLILIKRRNKIFEQKSLPLIQY